MTHVFAHTSIQAYFVLSRWGYNSTFNSFSFDTCLLSLIWKKVGGLRQFQRTRGHSQLRLSRKKSLVGKMTKLTICTKIPSKGIQFSSVYCSHLCLGPPQRLYVVFRYASNYIGSQITSSWFQRGIIVQERGLSQRAFREQSPHLNKQFRQEAMDSFVCSFEKRGSRLAVHADYSLRNIFPLNS